MNLVSYNTVVTPKALKSADAIVVLGGGVTESAKEYDDGVDLTATSLQRVRYASYLFSQTGLPILTTGGKLPGQSHSEAAIMKMILENTFITPVKWTEEDSLDSVENANLSRKILSAENIDRIVLVTHSWHMNRSAMLFEKAGFSVVRAPTGLQNSSNLSPMGLLPSAKAFLESAMAFKELYGQVIYSF